VVGGTDRLFCGAAHKQAKMEKNEQNMKERKTAIM
jgi:hypothetical protein